MKRFYYTFGTDKRYPYRGGWVEVWADNMQEADEIFRKHYPDRISGTFNCAHYYTEEEFRKTDMCVKGNLGAFCHDVIGRIEV